MKEHSQRIFDVVVRQLEAPSPRVRQGETPDNVQPDFQNSSLLSDVPLAPIGFIAGSGLIIMAAVTIMKRWRNGRKNARKGMKVV